MQPLLRSRKKYPDALAGYENILLVGINYDKDIKEHECVIENYRSTDQHEKMLPFKLANQQPSCYNEFAR